jgi:hypothetical protein
MSEKLSSCTLKAYERRGRRSPRIEDSWLAGSRSQEVHKGPEVVLAGAGPVWLYLKIVHTLHGKAKKLIYRSPVTGDMVIFAHDPF